MNIASILMDLAVVLIVIWQVRRGYHNGLMRMLIECLSCWAAAVLAVMISYAISGTIYDMFFAGRITEAVTNAILEAGSPEAFAGSLEQTLASMPEAIRSAAEFLMGGVDLSAVTSAQAAELAQTVTDSIVRPLITSAIQLVSFLDCSPWGWWFCTSSPLRSVPSTPFRWWAASTGLWAVCSDWSRRRDPVYPHPGAAVLLHLRHSVGRADTCCGTGELPHRNFL